MAVLALAVLAAYWNSFEVPLLLDDLGTISHNASIRRLWPLGPVLQPPEEVLSSGRPLQNLSFALNYAIGGEEVRGYHVGNILIHAAAALVLFALMARAFQFPRLRARFGAHTVTLAFAVAALWALHPINSESVTYISQRAESLMGLFYLATFYCFARAVAAPASAAWQTLTIVACACGMATKEVMVTAPVLLLLFDRSFVAESWTAIWRQRRGLYVGLALTWFLLAYLMASSHVSSRVTGTEHIFTGYSYLLTESVVVLRYIKLAIWPSPLVFDYGPFSFGIGSPVALAAFVILAAVFGGCVYQWSRGSQLAWCGLAWFVLLAPTSSVVPISEQPMAESRLYLPLIPVVIAFVGLVYRLASIRRAPILWALGACLLLLVVRRNADYRTDIRIWSDVVAKVPASSRAQNNLGFALARWPGHQEEARTHYEAALRLKPNYADAHNNLGLLLSHVPGHTEEAIAHFEAALRIDPSAPEAHNNLGNLFANSGDRQADAMLQFEAALRIRPDFPEAHNNVARVLMRTAGRQAEAEAHLRSALGLKPNFAEAENNLAFLLGAEPGREEEALRYYADAMRDMPNSAEIPTNMAGLLARMPGRDLEAVARYKDALRINPSYAQAHNNLGVLLTRFPGREKDAIAEFKNAVRLQPDYIDAQKNLAVMMVREGANGSNRAER